MNAQVKRGLKIAGWSVTGLIAFVIVLSGFYVNAEYERGVVTRLGEVQEVTGAGLHFKIPIIDSVYKADTRISSFEYPNMATATKDGQTIGVTITVNHKILDDKGSVQALYEAFGPGFNYEQRILARLAVDRVKGVIGKYQMEEFMPNREAVRIEAANVVRTAAAEYGINIEDVQISDIQFSPQYKQRLEQVAAARARAEEAKQQEREAEFTANKAIQEARGRAESQEREADAQAYAVTVTSEANAAAIQREGEAKAAALKAQAEVLKNSEGLIELTKAEAAKLWNGEFNPNVVMFGEGSGNGNGLIPFMNLNEYGKSKVK